MAVRERAVVLTVEVLAGVFVSVVTITVIPTNAGVDLQLFAVVVVQVATHHLPCIQSAAVPPAGILLLVIQVAHQHKAALIRKAATHSARRITVMCTTGEVEVGHVAAIHTLLNGKVEHRLLITIVDTGDTRLVALLVVELHILDDGDGQILQRRLRIAEHELLAVDEDFLYLLTVDGDVAILVHLGTGHTLNQLFNRRALRGAISLRTIDQRVFPNDNGCSAPSDDGFLQHHALGRHQQVPQVLILVAAQRNLTL